MSADSVLIIDDDVNIRKVVSRLLEDAGFETFTAGSGFHATAMVRENDFSVAIVDLKMPGMSGIETIEQLKKIDPDLEVIVFTGHPEVDSTIEAIRHQVFDYVTKPARAGTLERVTQRAAERRQLLIHNRQLLEALKKERDSLKHEVTAAKRVIERQLEESCELVGESEAIKRIRYSIAQIAPSDLTVLVLGERGTGKDVVARMIHNASGRDPNAFVKVNCPAIPVSLLESELFGHEPGAFTGAQKRKPGRFELAEGGTIFLDEIGDLPLKLQAKLLEVIEQRRFTRLGGRESIEVEVRIVAATNAPIQEMVAEGRFRRDIYYRLNEYSIHMPPLRERPEDIPLLIEHFGDLYGQRYGGPGLQLSPEILSRFTKHPCRGMSASWSLPSAESHLREKTMPP